MRQQVTRQMSAALPEAVAGAGVLMQLGIQLYEVGIQPSEFLARIESDGRQLGSLPPGDLGIFVAGLSKLGFYSARLDTLLEELVTA